MIRQKPSLPCLLLRRYWKDNLHEVSGNLADPEALQKGTGRDLADPWVKNPGSVAGA